MIECYSLKPPFSKGVVRLKPDWGIFEKFIKQYKAKSEELEVNLKPILLSLLLLSLLSNLRSRIYCPLTHHLPPITYHAKLCLALRSISLRGFSLARSHLSILNSQFSTLNSLQSSISSYGLGSPFLVLYLLS